MFSVEQKTAAEAAQWRRGGERFDWSTRLRGSANHSVLSIRAAHNTQRHVGSGRSNEIYFSRPRAAPRDVTVGTVGIRSSRGCLVQR